MSGKINGLNGAPPALDAGGGAWRTPETASGQASAAAVNAQSAGSDVHITDSASLLAGLAQHLRTLPAADQALVNHFRTSIDNGSYAVQPELIAHHLMQLEQSLAQIKAG